MAHLRRIEDFARKGLSAGALEVYEIADFDVKGVGNATEHVDADIGGARLDLPQIGTARAGHQREATLGDSLLFSGGFYIQPEAFLFARVFHRLSVGLLYCSVALFREPYWLYSASRYVRVSWKGEGAKRGETKCFATLFITPHAGIARVLRGLMGSFDCRERLCLEKSL